MEYSNQELKMFELWDYMVEFGICTDAEIGLVTALNGRRLDVLESILYIRTGYNSLEQMLDLEE